MSDKLIDLSGASHFVEFVVSRKLLQKFFFMVDELMRFAAERYGVGVGSICNPNLSGSELLDETVIGVPKFFATITGKLFGTFFQGLVALSFIEVFNADEFAVELVQIKGWIWLAVVESWCAFSFKSVRGVAFRKDGQLFAVIDEETRMMSFAIGEIVSMNGESSSLVDQSGFWGDAIEPGFKVVGNGDES